MHKPYLPLVVSFDLAVVGEIVAMVTDANLLIQLPLAWAVCILASCLTQGRSKEERNSP
jgi:hypothetical protein